MSNLKPKLIEEEEYERRFISAVFIYGKTDNKKLKDYAANIVADGFIKYSGDKIGEITLDVIRPDVMKYPELVEVIRNKAKEKRVKVSLGENTRKLNINNNKGINNSISQGRG